MTHYQRERARRAKALRRRVEARRNQRHRDTMLALDLQLVALAVVLGLALLFN